MARSAILSVRILGDATGATRAMRETAGESGRLSGAMGKIGGVMAAAAAATVAAAGGMAVGIGKAVQAASSLEQSSGAIDAVFKGNADQMHSMAASAATDLGLTRDEFNQLGTVIGSQLKNGGTAMSELAPKTNELIGVGADLAAMFGGTTADAVGALSSALKGERDPIERYGVSLNQASIDAKAAELGFTKVGGALSAEANQAATLALIMEQTADAHGAFGRESNTLAGQLERAKAGWGNIVATVGTAFLPMMTQAATVLNTTLMPALQSWAESLSSGGGLAAGMNALGSVVQTAFAQIGAAVTSFVSGWNGATASIQSSGLHGFFTQLGAVVHVAFAQIGAVVNPALTALGVSMSSAGSTLVQFTSAFSPLQLVLQGLFPVFPLLGALIGTVAGAFLQLMAAVIPVGTQIGAVLIPAITQIAAAVFPALLTIVQAVAAQMPVFSSGLAMVGGAVSALIGFIAPLVVQLVTGLAPIVADAAQRILPMLGQAFTALASAVGPIVQVLGTVLVPLFSNIIIPAVIAVAQALLTNLVGAFEGITRVITGAVTLVGALFRGDWGAAWNAAGQIVQGALQAVWNIVNLLFIGRVLGAVRGGLALVRGLFSSGWNGIAQFVSTAVARIGMAVSAGMTGITRFITGNLAGAQAAFRMGWTLITSVVKTAVTGIRTAVSTAMTAVRTTIVNIWNGIKATTSATWNGIRAGAAAAWNGIKTVVSGAVTGIRSAVTTGFNAVKTAVTSAWNAVKAGTTAAWNAIKAGISAAVTGVRTAVTTGFNAVKTKISQIWTNVKTATTGAWNSVKTTISGGVRDALAKIGEMPGKIKGYFANAKTWLVEAGKNIIQGLMDGAGRLLPKIGGFFADKLPSALRGPFKKALGIHSPSRVFAEYGGNISEGIGVGVVKKTRDATRAIEAAASAVIGTGRRELDAGLDVPMRVHTAPRLSPPSAGHGQAPTITINVNAGVGDPVEIGRQVDAVLSKYRKTVGI